MSNRMVNIILLVFATAIFAGVYFALSNIGDNTKEVLTNRANGKVTQTYTRFIACVTSQAPTVRTHEYTQDCYNKAEAATGTKVEHYGN